jgi:hypothetical protein
VTSTGTFVSCKDYDDDIDNLQEQINKLATKEDMTSQIATLQAALNTAAKDASDALTKATAAETAAKAAGDDAAAAKAAAEKSVAEAKAAAIEAAKAEVATAQAALEKIVADGLADNKTEMDKLRQEIAKATESVEAIIGNIADMVTSVELVESYSATDGQGHDLGYSGRSLPMSFTTAYEKDNVFETGIANAITFVKDTQVQTPSKFVIRVSPANAVLTPAMISLVNSQGQNLDDILTVKSVEKFTGLLSRASSNNGLWEVTVALKNYDKATYEAVAKTTVGGVEKKILYAVQVNNTLSTAATRYVTSSYDATLNWSEFTPASTLQYFVDNTNVKTIRNRFATAEDGTAAGYTELEWNANGPAVAAIKTGSNVNVVTGDNRDKTQGFALYPVVQGTPITISLTSDPAEIVAPTNIRALYVTLDYQSNAVESAPSEWNAWNSYSYTGLNTVVEGTTTQITINNATAINDVIGFRVYAVNYDGTLVDPDGKAFYVSVGAQIEDTAYNTTWTWKANGSSEISKEAVAEGVFDESWINKISTVSIESDTVSFGGNSQNAIGLGNIKFYKADKTTSVSVSAPTEDVAFITVDPTTITTPAYWYDDNKTYSATISYKNTNGNVIKTITVTLKKELPTFPTAFQAKVNQLNAEGTLNAFMTPLGATAFDGTKDLKQSFNGLDADVNYTFVFKDAQKNSAGELEDMTIGNTYTFTVANSFIDNVTKHAVEVSYNFGQISSETGFTSGVQKDYVVKGGEFKNVIFSCLAEINTYAWATAPSLTYAQTDGKTLLENIKSTNTRDGKYTTTLDKLITAACDNMIQNLSGATYELWSQVAKDGAIKEGSKNEYFTPVYAASVTVGTGTSAKTGEGITFTPNSEAQNPEATVYSTLIIKAKDYFNHDVVIRIANVEVKKR